MAASGISFSTSSLDSKSNLAPPAMVNDQNAPAVGSDDDGVDFRSRRRLSKLPSEPDGKRMDPTKRHDTFKTLTPDFEYGEHMMLGDTLALILEDGHAKFGNEVPLTLSNGLVLTYGQINGLAGDFYATLKPICLGSNFFDQKQRFQDAFSFLAEYNKTEPEAKKILALMQAEVDAVNAAIKAGKEPSTAYDDLPDLNVQFQAVTQWRTLTWYPTYAVISLLNLDHFGIDARTAYTVGHTLALEKAVAGDLRLAYAINAFADHFLEDSFSAGHIRTPRRLCHSGGIAGDRCAKFMHDEDSAIGLTVNTAKLPNAKWDMYGDKRLLDKVDVKNLDMCRNALQLSVNDIYAAWKTKASPPPEVWPCWNYVPDLSIPSQTLPPLFTRDGQRRTDVDDRRSHVFTKDFWWSTTATMLLKDPKFKAPITL